jgi:hypothetical protein
MSGATSLGFSDLIQRLLTTGATPQAGGDGQPFNDTGLTSEPLLTTPMAPKMANALATIPQNRQLMQTYQGLVNKYSGAVQ